MPAVAQVWKYEWLEDNPRRQQKGFVNAMTVSARDGWEVVAVTTLPGPFGGFLGMTRTWVLMRKAVAS